MSYLQTFKEYQHIGIVKECQDDLFVAFGNIIHAFSKMILSEVAISIIARQIV